MSCHLDTIFQFCASCMVWWFSLHKSLKNTRGICVNTKPKKSYVTELMLRGPDSVLGLFNGRHVPRANPTHASSFAAVTRWPTNTTVSSNRSASRGTGAVRPPNCAIVNSRQAPIIPWLISHADIFFVRKFV